MKYYLGIDGGGTKTTAAIADNTGNVIFKAVGKTINFYSVGMATARENLANLMDEINKTLGKISFEGAFIGCSALDWEADQETISSLCDGIIDAGKIGMNSDLFVALKASRGNCVAVCGTGSMAIGENADGEIIVAGGWGHILGDEGSAYSIAIKALKECARLWDKKNYSALLICASDFFDVKDFRDVINIIYSPESSKDNVASFAQKVGELAEKGDAAAKEILIAEARDFSKTVICILERLDSCNTLSLYGGLFENNDIFKEAFNKEISLAFPQINVRLLTTPPEEGAIIAAREL